MMATEKRLIDANAFKVFLEGVRQDYIEENTFSSDFAANVIETVQDNYLELAPTVDAVEVVRCKDCKYRGNEIECPMCFEQEIEWDDDGYTEVDWITHDRTQDDGFCHIGERKDND